MVLLYLPPVQQKARSALVDFLHEKTGATVALDRLDLRFPLGLKLTGLFVTDQRGDTLLYAGNLSTRVGVGGLLRNKILLDPVELHAVRAHLHQDADSVFNFDFIVNAFTGSDPAVVEAPQEDGGGMDFAIGSVHLSDILFTMRMEPSALGMELLLGDLDVGFDRFTLDPMAFHVGELQLKDTRLHMRTVSGGPTPSTYPVLENPMADLDVRFERMDLQRVLFTMATTNTGDSLWLAMDQADIRADRMDLTQQQLVLKKLGLDGLLFGMVTMADSLPADTAATAEPAWLGLDDGFRFWLQDWDLAMEELRIARSGIALHADSIAAPAVLFDPAHLVFTDLTLHAGNLVVNNERIALALEQLRVHGGPTAVPVELSALLNATPAAIALTQGHLKAMDNTIAFDMQAIPGDLTAAYQAPFHVPLKVDLRAALQMAQVVPLLDQLGMPQPPAAATAETWDTQVRLAGTAQALDTLALTLTGDQGSRIRLQGRLRDMDHWPRNTFSLALEDLTMGAGLRQVVRAYAPPEVATPRQLAARADISGSSGTVHSVFSVNSDLGSVTGFAVVKDWSGAMPDGVDMAVSAAQVQVAAFTGDTAIAPVDLKILASGDRLNSDRRNGTLSITPTVLMVNGNDLSSLRLNASATNDSVRVELSADAEPAKVLLTADGHWPHKGDSIALDMDLLVRRLRLQELGLLDRHLDVEGRWRGRIAFSNDGHGQVHLNGDGVGLSNGDRTFPFAEFSLLGLLQEDSTAVELNTDAITFHYHSNMGVDSLVPRTQAKLQSFFQADGAFVPVPGRRMDLAVTLPRTDWLTELVLPDLDVIELRGFNGRYDSDTDHLHLDIDVPALAYNGIEVQGLRVNAEADGNRLNGRVELARVERDSLFLEQVTLVATTAEEALQLLFTSMEGEREEYRVGASLRRADGIPVVHMDEQFVLHYRPWSAAAGNALYLAPDGLRAEAFELSSDAQRLALRTGQQRNHIELTAFDLVNITELIGTRDSVPVVTGVMDGKVSLPFVDQGRLEADLTVRELHALGVELGTLRMRADQLKDERFTAEMRLEHERNRLEASADIRADGPTPKVAADVELAFADLRFLKPFVSEYIFALEGGMAAALHIRAHGEAASAAGEITFDQAGIGVIQTGALYRLPDERIVLDDQGLLLNNVTMLDSAGNRFRLDGRVLLPETGEPALDLRLRTQRFQLVNSTIEQNDMFFGDLLASMDLKISGSARSPEVKGDLGILDGTMLSIVLPGSRVELIEHEGIVEFISGEEADSLVVHTDSEMLRDSLAARLPGVALDMRIKLDKRARFAVVIDPTTGDQATFSGEADLVFRYAPGTDIYLKGPFKVADGGYTLEFYGLVKKRFELVPGGTVIWDGDPLAGRMDIQARYRSETAPFPLVANAGGGISESERNRLQARLPFDVLINIKEMVNSPEISFGMDLDRLSRNNFPQVSNRLDQLAQPANEEELNRQVFGLLVLNSFIQDEASGGQPSGSLATTAARNSVNALLTEQLNRLTGRMVKGMDIQLGVNTYDQTAGNESYQRTAVDYKVSQRILNDRITIEAGGSLGVDERDNNVSNVSNNRAAQYSVTYDITKDGRLRLRGFHENAFDLYDGEIINNGVAIMLTRDFEENARDRERRREEARQRAAAAKPEEE